METTWAFGLAGDLGDLGVWGFAAFGLVFGVAVPASPGVSFAWEVRLSPGVAVGVAEGPGGGVAIWSVVAVVLPAVASWREGEPVGEASWGERAAARPTEAVVREVSPSAESAQMVAEATATTMTPAASVARSCRFVGDFFFEGEVPGDEGEECRPKETTVQSRGQDRGRPYGTGETGVPGPTSAAGGTGVPRSDAVDNMRQTISKGKLME